MLVHSLMPALPEIYEDKVDLALRAGLVPVDVLERVQKFLDEAPVSAFPADIPEKRIAPFSRP